MSTEAKISLCMIVKNEAANIRRCLSSVAGVVDGIVVVDTGSTDTTCEILEEYGIHPYSFPWTGSFSDARNFSLAQATGDWVLILDADEELAADSGVKLRQLVANSEVDGYFIKIVSYLGDERWDEPCSDLVFRLFRNRQEYRFHGAVHEQIADVILECNSRANIQITGEIVILHYGYLNKQVDDKDKINRNLTLLDQELRREPGNRLLLYHYGVELHRSGRFLEAVDALLRAADGLDPQTIYHPKLLRQTVLAYYAAGLYEQAVATAMLGLKFYPDYADLLYYAGMANMKQKRFGHARQFLQRALQTPTQPIRHANFSGMRGFHAWYQLGYLAELFLEEETAMRCYLASLNDNAFFTPALQSVIRLLQPRQDPVGATAFLKQVFECCTLKANLMVGQILFRQHAFGPALAYLEILEGSAVLDEVKLWKAICLSQLRRFDESIDILRSFPEEHILFPLVKLNHVLCYRFQHQYALATKQIEELQSLELPADTHPVVSLLQNTLADQTKEPAWQIDVEGRSMPLLLDIIRRALDLGEEEFASSLVDHLSPACRSRNGQLLGELFFESGYLDAAGHYLQLQANGQATRPDMLFNLAEIRRRQGDFLDAGCLYRQALEIDPGQPKYYLRLAALYREIRTQVLSQAAEWYPDAPELQSFLKAADQ